MTLILIRSYKYRPGPVLLRATHFGQGWSEMGEANVLIMKRTEHHQVPMERSQTGSGANVNDAPLLPRHKPKHAHVC